MPKTSQDHYEAVAAALADDGAVMSQMFGMPSLKINGKAFAGLWDDYMIFKLTGDTHAEALAERGAKLFDPMDGRPMREWVQVPVASAKNWKGYAESALEYVKKSAAKKPAAHKLTSRPKK